MCTEVFEKMAELEKAALGMPDLQLAIIPHPLMNRETLWLEETIDAIIMPKIAALFGAGGVGTEQPRKG